MGYDIDSLTDAEIDQKFALVNREAARSFHGFLGGPQWAFLYHQYLGVELIHFILFALIIVITLLLKRAATGLITHLGLYFTRHLKEHRSLSAVRQKVHRPLENVLQIVLYYIAICQLSGVLTRVSFRMPGTGKVHRAITLDDVADAAFLFFFIIFFTQAVSRLIDFILDMRIERNKQQTGSHDQLLPLMKEISKMLLWTLCVFWLLGSVFHVNIPALITGLGIGGIAIALAGKTTVENLFAAFTILSDKPFQTGDTIKLLDMEGRVERIGFRSTRLRGADGVAFVVPNANLVSNNISNLSLRNVSDVKVLVNIKYGLTHDVLSQIIEELRVRIRNTAPVIGEAVITLETFGETTFQLSVVYHVPQPLPDEYKLTQVKQAVNLAIYELVTSRTEKGAATIEAKNA